MSKIKILGIVGSNNQTSFTNVIVNRLFKEIKILDSKYQSEIICLNEYKIDYCAGCITCFYKGFCPMDKNDDFGIIRNKLLESDIIFFASPVYIHGVPGIMKTFFDRISSYSHLLGYAGMLGFTITTTDNNGQDLVSDYMMRLQNHLGIKNMDNYIYIREDDNIEEFIKTSSSKFIEDLENNFGYSNKALESKFNYLKESYEDMIVPGLDKGLQKTFELNYWNQIWIKECSSFQEFAVKNKQSQK